MTPFFAALIASILIRQTDTQSTTCTGSTYSYGSTSCSSCPTGATIVTGNARGCTPSTTLTPGPSDSLVFYLSGTSTEGVSAFPNAPTVSYVTSPFGDVNGALTLSSGSSLSLTPSVGSGLLSVLPSGNSAWSASAWVKCASLMTRASIFEWGDANGIENSQRLRLTVSSKCPQGWTQSSSSTCYKMFSQPLSWADANTMCATQGQNGALASFRNAGEFNSLLSLTTSNAHTWIGANSIGRANYDYIFVRGGVGGFSGANAGSGQWCSAQPDNAGSVEKCINILQHSQFGYNCLNDYPCNLATPYICEIGMDLPVCDSKWHHLAVTHGDGSTTNSKTYVDGALVSTTSQTLTIQTDGTSSLVLGSKTLLLPGSTYSFSGSPGVSTCPTGVSSFVSSSLPCAPITGPTDTSFYFSCDEAEGLGAYSVTNPSGITFVADRFGTPGRALQLNDAYFATPVAMPLSVGNAARSVALFVKCISLAGDYTPLIWWGASSNNAASGLTMLNANTMHWSFWGNDVYCPNCWSCDGMWHHWASTFDGTKVTVYLDSVVKISETKSTNTATGTTLKIGREPNFGGVFNKNTGFDDIRIYNRALSANEIADIYNNNARISFHDIRLYNRALASSEIFSLSQPPLTALGAATNTVLMSTPSTDSLSYAFSCSSGTRGNGGTFTQTSIDQSWSWSPRPLCDYCPPGTFSQAGAFSCSLCPSGYYGNIAELTSPTCSGPCPVPSECPAGTAYPPSSLSTLSCASGGVRAIPSTLGMRLWPAAHPANPQKVDLIIAPLNVCEAHTHQSCLQRSSVSMGGVTLYTVGTAAELHMEPAEDLTCLVQ
jgi:hypothetical protein